MARQLRHGEFDAAVSTITGLASPGGATAIGDCRSATSMLNGAIAEMVDTLCRDTSGPRTFGVVLADEYGEIPIDDVPPHLRAEIRAVVAELNGDPETATTELDLAFASGDATTAGKVAAQSLAWATDLMEHCAQMHQESPRWLN